jgi:ubiquinone/menaquinone biosynthesis C-methylase UbiE
VTSSTPSAEPDRQKERVAGLFGRAAPAYDQVGPRFFAQFGSRLVELAQVRQGETVLDIACGRGASLFPAAGRVGPAGRAVGIDLAESMIDEVSRDIDARGLVNVEAHVMDAEDLRFPPATFDHVLCGFCLFFFPQRERALSEMKRVLKPGGRLAISTWGKIDAQWQWLDDLLDSYLPEPDPSPEEGDDKEGDTESPGRMRAVLRQAGFADTGVVAEAHQFTYATEEEWWATQWSHGVRDGLEQIEARLGPEGLARFKSDALQKIRALKQPGSAGIHHVLRVLYTLAVKPQRDAVRPSA